MHTYIIYFRGFVVGSQSLLTWGFVQGRAVRRRHCVGGGAPPFPKYRGARRRWRKVFDLEDFDLGFVRGRAVRRLHCVGGRAPVNFGGRQRLGGGPEEGGGGGAHGGRGGGGAA